MKLNWMNAEGEPVPYGEIGAGKRARQKTRPGAVWMISDQSDSPLGYFVVDDRTARAMIPVK